MEFSWTAKTKQFTNPRNRIRKKNSTESILSVTNVDLNRWTINTHGKKTSNTGEPIVYMHNCFLELTKRCHVAVRLCSNRLQMTSI